MIRYSEVLERSRRKTDHDLRMYPVLTRTSKAVTWLLLNLGVSANQTTVLVFLAAVASAGFFAFGTTRTTLAVALALFWLHVVLDFSDGDIARFHQKYARNGEYWDHVIHLFTIPLILAGIVMAEVGHEAPQWAIAAALLLTVIGAFNRGLTDVAKLASIPDASPADRSDARPWYPRRLRGAMHLGGRIVGIQQSITVYAFAVMLFDEPLWHELALVVSAFLMLLAVAFKTLVAHRRGGLPLRTDLLG